MTLECAAPFHLATKALTGSQTQLPRMTEPLGLHKVYFSVR